MRETNMDIDWRTVQLFLSDEEGVSEVQIDADDNRKVRCDCAAFMSSARCKHSKFVKARMAENDGHYAIRVPEDIPDEVAFEALSHADSFRDFILKYGKIEVL
jgi:hypothetical protein